MIWVAFALGVVVGLAMFAAAVTIGLALHDAGQARRTLPTPSRATNPAADEWIHENVRHATGPFKGEPCGSFDYRTDAHRSIAQEPPR